MNLFRRFPFRGFLGLLVAVVGLTGLGFSPWIPFDTTLERFVPPGDSRPPEDMMLLVSMSRPGTARDDNSTVRDVFDAIRDHPAVREGVDPVAAASRSGLPLAALWSGLAVPGGQGFRVAGLPVVKDGGRILNGLYRISSEYRAGTRLLEDLEAIRARTVPDGWTLSMAGLPVINGWLAREARGMQARLIPAMIGITIGMLLLFYRSWRVLFTMGVSVGVAVGWTFTAMRLMGYPHDLLSVLPPMLVMVITVSGAVHVLSELAAVSGPMASRLDHALGRKGPPAFFCHLSTGVGFGSLALSGMPAVRALGVVSAIGVLGMSLVLFTVVPPLVRLLIPAPDRCRVSLPVPGVLRRIGSHPLLCRAVLIVALGLILVGGIRYPGLSFESRAMMYFSPDHPLRVGIDRVSRDFTPPRHDLLRLRADPPFSRTGRETWAVHLSHLPGVRRVMSGPRLERSSLLPDDEPGVTRALVFYSNDVLNDLSAVRARIVEETVSRLPGSGEVTFEGVLDRVNRVQEELQRTLQLSMLAAGGIIFLMLAGIVRDPWYFSGGVLGNLLPLAGVVLLVDVSGTPLDAGMILIFSVTLGLALDDTLHYLHEHRSGRGTPEESVSRIFSPLVVTTVVLCTGIGAFSMAAFKPVAHFGTFASAGLMVALVADVLVLPAFFSLTGS